MMRKYLVIFQIIGLLLLISGCGYQFLPNMPEHIKTVYVPVFKNNTIQFGLGSQLTNELINELNLDGTLKKASREEADSEFRGEIIQFIQTPVSFYEDKTVKEYRVFIKVYIEFWDMKRSKKIWDGNISRSENYIVRQYSSEDLTVRTGVFFSKDDAINTILQGISRDIVSRTMEGW